MHLHVLGIGGTFMSALAIIAQESGFKVTGSDANCYPPVSDLLRDKGIIWTEGYDDDTDMLAADCVIVGNAIKRGMPVVESMLSAKKPYISGPEWLYDVVLSKRRVIAVAGTHGKTTTTCMLAHILDKAGANPGFLIGGVAPNFNTSARIGKGEWFVIEADEYDTAFFDKRPKFMHYRPEVAILNNLEFDHADIYANLDAIKLQFQYFLRTIPPQGTVLKPLTDAAINEVITRGQFCRVESFSSNAPCDWEARLEHDSGTVFSVYYRLQKVGTVTWDVIGRFNVENALAAIAASHKAGVSVEAACEALKSFKPVKRRLEVKAIHREITLYDDFAHHPTAIAKTIEALKRSARHQRILVVLEFASNTMKMGINADMMANALNLVDGAYILKPSGFDVEMVAKNWKCPYFILNTTDEIIDGIMKEAKPNDAILIMSNKGFENIHQRMSERFLREKVSS